MTKKYMKGTTMAERRNNYTGGDIVSAEQKDHRKDKHPPITPIMILNDVARRWHHLVEDGAPTQFMQNSSRAILRELFFKTGVCQLDLAKATHLKPPTISVALNKMEQEGIVTRSVDNNDMRATRVYLTDKGIAMNEQIHDRIVNADTVALRGFSEEDKATLASLLDRIRNNFLEETKDK